MTTKTKTGAPFEYFKGMVYASDDGLDVWNQVSVNDLSPPDEVEVNMDSLSGEITLLEHTEEMDPQSGQRPPTSGAPDPEQVQMPDYLSPDVGGSGGNYDEDFTPYLDRMSKVYTPARETEIEKGKFLRYKELYKSLSKGWDSNEDINRIIQNTERMMKMFPDDGPFLEKCGELLCSFDYRAPTTKFVKVLRKNFSKGELAEMVEVGRISKADMENALAFEEAKREAKAMDEARAPTTLDFTLSRRSLERFPEAKEDVERRCETCKTDEDGRFLRCERCSMKNKNTEVEQT